MTSPSSAAPTAAARKKRPREKSYEKPREKSYENLTGSHGWETHLPPSPEGRLLVSADYCPECGAGLRFLLDPDGAILAARLDQQPGVEPRRRSLFILQNGRMEPADAEACRRILQDLNHGSEPAWSIAPGHRENGFPPEVPAPWPGDDPRLRRYAPAAPVAATAAGSKSVPGTPRPRLRPMPRPDARVTGPEGPRLPGPGAVARLPGVPLPR